MATIPSSISFTLIIHLLAFVTLASARPGWLDSLGLGPKTSSLPSDVLTPAADFDGSVIARQILIEEMTKDELDRLVKEGQKKLDDKKMDDVQLLHKAMVNSTDEFNATFGVNATSSNSSTTAMPSSSSTTTMAPSSTSSSTSGSPSSTKSTPVDSSTVLSTTKSPSTSTTVKDDRVNEPVDFDLLNFADQADEADVSPQNATTTRVSTSTTPAPQSSSTTVVSSTTSETPQNSSSTTTPAPKNVIGSGASQLYASLAICLALALFAATTC